MRRDTLRGRRLRAHSGNGQIASTQGVTCLFVGAQEYCELAVSQRRLIRCDDKARGMRGLQDLETGERFLVAEADLFAHSVAHPSTAC
jgi:hypothetical protein